MDLIHSISCHLGSWRGGNKGGQKRRCQKGSFEHREPLVILLSVTTDSKSAPNAANAALIQSTGRHGKLKPGRHFERQLLWQAGKSYQMMTTSKVSASHCGSSLVEPEAAPGCDFSNSSKKEQAKSKSSLRRMEVLVQP